MARFLNVAETKGVLPVRNWWRSSPVTMSLTQWRRFSTVQCPRAQAATCSGRASVMGSEQNRVDHLDLLLALDGAGAPDPDHLGRAGEVDPGGGLDGFDGAQYPPPVGVVGDGDGRDGLPGQLLELPAQTGLVALDRQQVVAVSGDDPLGPTHLGAPWRRRRPGPRPAPTARAGPSGRGSRWTHPTPAALPRRLRRPGSGAAGRWGPRPGLRAWSHPPRRSPSCRQYAHPGAHPGRYTRVEVARVHPPGHLSDRGLATAGPARPPGPEPPGRPGPRSATCSRIAARVRHPARTPTTAKHPAETRARAHAPPVPRIGHALKYLPQWLARGGGCGRR